MIVTCFAMHVEARERQLRKCIIQSSHFLFSLFIASRLSLESIRSLVIHRQAMKCPSVKVFRSFISIKYLNDLNLKQFSLVVTAVRVSSVDETKKSFKCLQTLCSFLSSRRAHSELVI